MNRNVYLLFCCQALMNAVMSGQTVMSALIGHALAVDKALNTLPMAIQMTATMTASIPAGIVFARLGRKPGFWLGCAGSLLGSLTFALGVWTRELRDLLHRRRCSPAWASASPSTCASQPPRSRRPRRAPAPSPW